MTPSLSIDRGLSRRRLERRVLDHEAVRRSVEVVDPAALELDAAERHVGRPTRCSRRRGARPRRRRPAASPAARWSASRAAPSRQGRRSWRAWESPRTRGGRRGPALRAGAGPPRPGGGGMALRVARVRAGADLGAVLEAVAVGVGPPRVGLPAPAAPPGRAGRRGRCRARRGFSRSRYSRLFFSRSWSGSPLPERCFVDRLKRFSQRSGKPSRSRSRATAEATGPARYASTTTDRTRHLAICSLPLERVE